MLGKTWRLVADNETGVVVASIIAEAFLYNFSSTGALQYSGTVQSFLNLTSLATGAVGIGATQDNSTTLFLGSAGAYQAVDITLSGSTGAVTLYYQESPDGGTTWPGVTPAAVGGIVMQSFYFVASGTQTSSAPLPA